jgi:hypothetical protein
VFANSEALEHEEDEDQLLDTLCNTPNFLLLLTENTLSDPQCRAQLEVSPPPLSQGPQHYPTIVPDSPTFKHTPTSNKPCHDKPYPARSQAAIEADLEIMIVHVEGVRWPPHPSPFFLPH